MNTKIAPKVHHLYRIIMLLAIFVFLCVLYSALNIENLPNSRFIPNQVNRLTGGWYTVDNFGEQSVIQDLNSWREKSSSPITLYLKLPQLNDMDYLFIENNFNYIKVLIDGNCVYNYSSNSINFPANMSGHFICQIPLERSFSGKTLSVEIYQPHSFLTTGIKSVIVGTGSAYITDYLYSHIELIITLFFMLVVGFCMFLVFLWQKHRKMEYNFSIFGNLTILSLFSALWIFTDSQLPQIFWNNNIIICILSFFSFMILPLPMLSIVSTLCEDNNRVLEKMKLLLALNMVVQGLLYIFGNVSLVTMLPITHLLIVANIIVLLIFLVHRLKGSTSQFAKPLLLSLIFLIISAILSLIQFYMEPQTDNSLFYRYGFILFICILIYVGLKAMVNFFNNYAKHNLLKRMAYTDILTNVESRLAFEEYFHELHNRDIHFSFAIYVCDLNNLKFTNDTYGHKVGDIILAQAAGCISKVFSNIGRVFRIGGDEFVVLVESPPQNAPEYAAELEKEIMRECMTSAYTFTISTGYAYSKLIIKDELDALLKQADEDMYKNKIKSKEKNK